MFISFQLIHILGTHYSEFSSQTWFRFLLSYIWSRYDPCPTPCRGVSECWWAPDGRHWGSSQVPSLNRGEGARGWASWSPTTWETFSTTTTTCQLTTVLHWQYYDSTLNGKSQELCSQMTRPIFDWEICIEDQTTLWSSRLFSVQTPRVLLLSTTRLSTISGRQCLS